MVAWLNNILLRNTMAHDSMDFVREFIFQYRKDYNGALVSVTKGGWTRITLFNSHVKDKTIFFKKLIND